ncbi:MAG: class I SAM-dependent RNA methyltransferase [Ferruginibacter sp.]|nr:class I SAM-dependent RNA methyltransferase [Ferruginibacter sp.]
MKIFTTESRIIITCSNRLSIYLEKEITALGYTPVRIFKTGVEIFGTMQDCIRLNLNLRCASQVLFSIKEFRAVNADDVYNVALNVEWENIIPAEGYFSISSNVSNETITNNLFANVKVKDAIADRFRDKTGSRPDSGATLNGVVVHLFWKEEAAELFIDTSGETLSKHGYRKIPGKAPMLEALAAGVLYATNWNKETPFINPMCGSGTIAIEAALMATHRVPGLYRSNYSFMHLEGFNKEIYEAEFEKIEAQVVENASLKIIVSDISEDAINVSKVNAGMAGVEDMLTYEVCDFQQTTLPDVEGSVIIFNPEYGDRLGVEEALEETYALMGDFMKKKCKGYTGYIFTGNLELAKKIGLKPKRRIEFFTSKIDCRLLEYELYAGSREKKKE